MEARLSRPPQPDPTNRAEALEAIDSVAFGTLPRRHPNLDLVSVQQTTGPLPPPAMLVAYPPDVQTFIIEGAKTQAKHRQDIEQRQMAFAEKGQAAEIKLLNRDRNHRLLGIWLGYTIVAAPFAFAAWALATGKELAAVVSLASALGLVVSRYLAARARKARATDDGDA